MNTNKIMPDHTNGDICQILKALADPNRLRIFEILMQGDSCNGRLNEQLGLAPNLLSHHLNVLRQAGMVTDRRDAVDARWIYYTVNREALVAWYGWLTTFFDPARLNLQPNVCGPEHMLAALTVSRRS